MSDCENENFEVRKVQKADIPALIKMLLRAFDNDPFVNYFCRQDKKRTKRTKKFFEFYFEKMAMPHGEVYCTNNLLGASLWSPPGKWKLSFFKQLFAFPEMIYTTSIKNFLSRIIFINSVEKYHPEEPHWYLQVIGTDPINQCQGIGSAVLRPVLSICDQEGIPAYLETSNELNIPFYEAKGFFVTKELEKNGDNPKIWLMLRKPIKTYS